MRRWIHRSAVTALAAAGLVAASSGLATGTPDLDSDTSTGTVGEHNTVETDTGKGDTAGTDAVDEADTDAANIGEEPRAAAPLPLPSELDPQQISPHLQPRSIGSPSAAEATATMGQRWAGPGQVHPLHIDS